MPRPAASQAGTLVGRSSTTSWIAPSGQTAAQNVRPVSSAANSGTTKNRIVAGRIGAVESAMASATFCSEPTGQTHPSRTKPNQIRLAIVSSKSPVRLRRRWARCEARTIAKTNTPISASGGSNSRSAGNKVTGST
jgi:hypothetical protein